MGELFSELRNINLQLQKNIFVIGLMCDVNDVWKVRESLTKEGCIHTEVLFIADRPGKKGGMCCFKI